MRSAFLTTALLLTGSLAYAQGTTPQISYEAITSAPQGAWAEYETTMKGQAQKITMKYALVEKSAKKMALEVSGQTPMGPVLMRMELTPASEPDTWKISAAKVKMGDKPAQDQPIPDSTPPIKKGGGAGTAVGHGAVKTPVGSFECKQYKMSMPTPGGPQDINIWMSDKVTPVGLVKQDMNNGQLTTILSATGTGAKSQLDAAAAPAKPAKK
jgi:hypothetical protein